MDASERNEYYNVSPFNRKESTKGRPQYESRSAFKGGDSGETDLTEGEIVSVLEKTGTGWWLVQSATGVGWVPSHFLKLPKDNPVGRTVEDLPGDEFEQTAPQKYTPHLPPGKRESMKMEGHIAFRYMQSARGTGAPNGDNNNKDGGSHPKPPPAAAKPKGFPAQKPSGSPHVTPSSSISSTASSVFSASSGPGSGSSKSSGSSTSSGSGSGFKPMPAPRRGGGGGQNPSTDTGEEGSTRSVKDLKAMFSKR